MYNPFNPATFYSGAGNMDIGHPRLGTESYYDMISGRINNIVLTLQDPPNWRYDVVSFEAKPFEENIVLQGTMSADVYMKSDCEDTCFYARVILVKDGVAYGLRDDITSLYTPSTPVPSTHLR
jgi:predicted acyl esterase